MRNYYTLLNIENNIKKLSNKALQLGETSTLKRKLLFPEKIIGKSSVIERSTGNRIPIYIEKPYPDSIQYNLLNPTFSKVGEQTVKPRLSYSDEQTGSLVVRRSVYSDDMKTDWLYPSTNPTLLKTIEKTMKSSDRMRGKANIKYTQAGGIFIKANEKYIGLGSLLHQITQELSHLNGLGGFAELESNLNAKIFHYKSGYRQANPLGGNFDELFDQMIQDNHISDNPPYGNTKPMTMREGLSLDNRDAIRSGNWLQLNPKEHGKLFWMNQPPVLFETRQRLRDGTLIRD